MDSPIVSSAEMRFAEDAAFARGITAEALMDEAGAGIAHAISKFFPTPGTCILFAGKGNNAGDGLVAAEHLRARGWAIETRLACGEGEGSELMRRKLRDLQSGSSLGAPNVAGLRPIPHSGPVIVDGLLGLGAKPPLREPIRAACREINRLRAERNAFVVALDIPTGLDSDSGEADNDCVVADFTVTIGFAKQGLIADRALNFVGRLDVVPLPELTTSGHHAAQVATAASLSRLIPRRHFGVYKNEFGRVGIVAGSRGFTGAAVLCAKGALAGGAGLVEIFVPEDIYDIVAASAPPEAMVKSVRLYEALLDNRAIVVWAIGPGIGQTHPDEILKLIEHLAAPCVLDADALNILSEAPEILKQCGGPRLITPHPGEMKRLFHCDAELSRADVVKHFCAEYPATLLLKGSRTIIGERDRPLSFNTTGNPGMATGGMGDVLTGICAALVAQKLSLYDAARVGAWVAGRAAEIAIFHGDASEQTLLPTDVAAHLGLAFRDLQSGATR